jgi:hypothetical protein
MIWFVLSCFELIKLIYKQILLDKFDDQINTNLFGFKAFMKTIIKNFREFLKFKAKFKSSIKIDITGINIIRANFLIILMLILCKF